VTWFDSIFNAAWQKAAQRELEDHQRLMDATCLWVHVRPKLKDTISNEYMTKIDEMWANGCLGSKKGKTRHHCWGGKNPSLLFGEGKTRYCCLWREKPVTLVGETSVTLVEGKNPSDLNNQSHERELVRHQIVTGFGETPSQFVFGGNLVGLI